MPGVGGFFQTSGTHSSAPLGNINYIAASRPIYLSICVRTLLRARFIGSAKNGALCHLWPSIVSHISLFSSLHDKAPCKLWVSSISLFIKFIYVSIWLFKGAHTRQGHSNYITQISFRTYKTISVILSNIRICDLMGKLIWYYFSGMKVFVVYSSKKTREKWRRGNAVALIWYVQPANFDLL